MECGRRHREVDRGRAVGCRARRIVRVETVRPLDLGKARVKGFVGTCTYSLGPKATAEARLAFQCLAEFAFHAGVGEKTTMGMGQVICEPA